jgi:hypothetical protein
VVKGERQNAAWLQDAMRLAPALREQSLIEAIWIFGFARAVGDCLQ